MCCLAQQLPMGWIAFIRSYFLMGLKHRWNQGITLIHFGAEPIAQSCSFNYAICLVPFTIYLFPAGTFGLKETSVRLSDIYEKPAAWV